MQNFDSENRLFVFDQKKWKKFCEKDYYIPIPPSVTEVKNGIVLPLKIRKDVTGLTAGTFEGGVCDSNGTFVAGLCRNINKASTNLACSQAYSVPEYVETRHETVVFGGLLFGHFGHLISDGFTRLWWFADHPDTSYKIIFLDVPVGGGFKYYNILETFGITKERMEIITSPTQFDKIIVPQETLNLISSYRPGVGKIYDYIRNSVKPDSYKKIYLSRAKLNDAGATVNEEYYESFYRKRGYKIVCPEQLPFDKQISIMAGADEVIAIHGTLVHLTAFCKAGTRIVILNRSQESANIFSLLQGRQADYYIIDAHFSFLPSKMSETNVYFMGPTVYWKQYLDKLKIPYTDDELSLEEHMKPYLYDYITKWGNLLSSPKHYKKFRNQSLIDLICNINRDFLQTIVSPKIFAESDEIIKLKKETEKLKIQTSTLENTIKEALIESAKENSTINLELEQKIFDETEQIEKMKREIISLKSKIYGMQDSLSWRITAPLRHFKTWLKRNPK